MPQGSLHVVGTGITLGAQVSVEALSQIESADKLYFVVADPLSVLWLEERNKNAECLNSLYQLGKERSVTYEEMIARVLDSVRSGLRVCFASYGHPGVFSYPTHEAVRRARTEGYAAVMYPAISAEDCLFADLNVDPATTGLQSFEATDFLLYRRVFDPHCALLFWQAGAIGEKSLKEQSFAWSRIGLEALTDVLSRQYEDNHTIVAYQAASYAPCRPEVNYLPLSKLPAFPLSVMSLLYVPPCGEAERDWKMAERLGMPPRRRP